MTTARLKGVHLTKYIFTWEYPCKNISLSRKPGQNFQNTSDDCFQHSQIWLCLVTAFDLGNEKRSARTVQESREYGIPINGEVSIWKNSMAEQVCVRCLGCLCFEQCGFKLGYPGDGLQKPLENRTNRSSSSFH